jgi:hypothetical protein
MQGHLKINIDLFSALCPPQLHKTFKEPKNRFQGTNCARLCSLAGRYNNPIPTRFLAPIDSLKIPAQTELVFVNVYGLGIDSLAP